MEYLFYLCVAFCGMVEWSKITEYKYHQNPEEYPQYKSAISGLQLFCLIVTLLGLFTVMWYFFLALLLMGLARTLYWKKKENEPLWSFKLDAALSGLLLILIVIIKYHF